MWKRWRLVLVGLLVAAAALGLARVRFDTDVLSVLPSEMPEVRGLKAFQDMFSRDQELTLLMEAGEADAGTLGEAAGELGELLESVDLASGVRWRPEWSDDPEGLAELVGWLWLNGGTEPLRELEASLEPERIEQTLLESLERVATALDGAQMMLSAHDPFGFLGHPSMSAFLEASEDGGEGFESADGRAHLVFIDAPIPVAPQQQLEGYQDFADWIERVRAVAEPWASERGIELHWTGDPAFQAEIGTAMEGDMSGTVGVTALLIGLLFLAMQRKPGLLLGLGLVLGLVLACTMGLAGWIYGELKIMAAGFAAILIGLSVDYGVLICQEAKVAGHDEGRIRGAVSRSILWAAATTSAVFLALNLSGLPGIAQLGTMVALGVALGALLMLVVYLPWVAKVGSGRPGNAHKAARLPTGAGALALAGGMLFIAVAVLAWRGAPGVEFDRNLLRPRDSEAMAAFERIQEKFPAWGSPALRLVVEGGTDDQVRDRLVAARRRVEELRDARPDLIRRVDVPVGWWPSPEHVEENRSRLERLASEGGRILAAADEVGFSDEGTGLGRAVIGNLPGVLALEPGTLPDSAPVRELLRGRVAKEDQGGRVLGTVEVVHPDELTAHDFAQLRSLSGDGVYLAGWVLLKPAVLPLVRRDLTDVFLPMVGLMVVMLSLVFRKPREVLLALGMMALSGTLLLAAMRWFGLSWNFLNIAATPLLLGTGLDYTIHILLAMRRNGGDLQAVWNGTGKAVLFCGVSTAIGFGSLAFASIDALASLGKVAVLGILIVMGVSVLLLPGLSRCLGAKERRA